MWTAPGWFLEAMRGQMDTKRIEGKFRDAKSDMEKKVDLQQDSLVLVTPVIGCVISLWFIYL